MTKRLSILFILSILPILHGFIIDSSRAGRSSLLTFQIEAVATNDESCVGNLQTRRGILASSLLAGVFALIPPAIAATREPLDELLYRIVRVREATVLETRLIKTGKFKDVQRSNIKLAIRFMVENYRLNDAFVAASTYLDGTSRRLAASQIGQSVTQNLYTILEYFDAADVQNLKVSLHCLYLLFVARELRTVRPPFFKIFVWQVGQTSLSNKEDIVLKGLDSARKNIDEFLAFFPASDLTAVNARVSEENALNVKEFDTSLGPLINMPAA
jgi:hypothetical protein